MIATSGHLVTVMSGQGSAALVGEKAKELGMTKVMLVCDKGVRGAGVVDPIVENLKAAGLGVVIYDGVLPDPPDTVVTEAVELAGREKVDGFVAVGGGSSMDTAKAANVVHKYGGNINDYFYWHQKGYPLIALPTTAGTGSETTYGAVISNSVTHKKGGVFGKAAYVDLAIVDPLLYVGVPMFSSVAGAFDAYTHAVEAIIHHKPEPIAEAYAEKALRLIHRALPKLVKDLKDIKAREDMALAATLAGAAINTCMCHHSHAIGHSLGSVFHLPHGACCAVGFKDLLKIYAEWLPERTRVAAAAMGLDLPENISNKELGDKISAHFLAFAKSVGLPNLKEMLEKVGAPKEKLDEAIKMMPEDVAALSMVKVFDLRDKYGEITRNAFDE